MIGSRSLGATVHAPVRVLGRTFPVAQLAVAAFSGLGLLLAGPSIWWPTARLVVSDPERGAVLSTQSTWSWGKVVLGNGESFERTFPNAIGLAFLIATLVIGLAAVIVWGVHPGRVGGLWGVLGLTTATVRVLTSVAERLGDSQVDAFQNTGLDSRSYLQPAAVTETIAAVLLTLALAGMVALALDSAPGVPEPSGIPTRQDGTTPGTGRARLSGPATGFSDDAPRPDERPDGRPDHRFEPPA